MDNTLRGEFNLSAPLDSDVPKTGTKLNGHSNLHFFSSFASYPEGISFEEQKVGETIELLLRRHFVTNVPWILGSLILIILPIFFPILFANPPFPMPSSNIVALLVTTYYTFIFGFVLLNFTLWYFHTGIVTNLRVIDTDITGILFRVVSEAKNEDIQDVTYTQIGFIRSLFNFGDVSVQTSGSVQNIEFDRVPKPSIVARIIGELSHHKKNHG